MLFLLIMKTRNQHIRVKRTYNIGDEITIVETMDWFEYKTYIIV